MIPPTTNGHAPRTRESRESYQFVNLDFFDVSKGAEGVIKLTIPLGKSPACDMVRLCFVVFVSVSVSVSVCVLRVCFLHVGHVDFASVHHAPYWTRRGLG